MMWYFPLKWLRAQFSCRQPLVFSLMYCINIQARNWHCTCIKPINKMWRYFEGVLPPPSKRKKADEASEKQSKYEEERKRSFLLSWHRPWLKCVNSSAAASTSETPATGGAMFLRNLPVGVQIKESYSPEECVCGRLPFVSFRIHQNSWNFGKPHKGNCNSDSEVEDASDSDSDIEERQVERWIKKCS